MVVLVRAHLTVQTDGVILSDVLALHRPKAQISTKESRLKTFHKNDNIPLTN